MSELKKETNGKQLFKWVEDFSNHIFKEEIDKGGLSIYLDDLMIYSSSLKEHCEKIKWIMDILWQYKLSLKYQKCKFKWPETEYLGLIISEGQIQIDPVKVQAVTN
jgi:hypothetical protein